MNECLLEGRAVFLDVLARLRVSDIEQLHRRRVTFERCHESWIQLKVAAAMSSFTKFVLRDNNLTAKLQMVTGLSLHFIIPS